MITRAILTIRTDKPEAEIGLQRSDGTQLDYDIWYAHRQLAETLHVRIRTLLERNGLQLKDIGGIVCYQGPGSFTGLRIGLTVGNALAMGLQVPIVAEQNPSWINGGVTRLSRQENDHQVLPFYGADVHITAQKK